MIYINRHQEDDNYDHDIFQMSSNELMDDLNVAKTAVMDSGYALMGNLSNSWSVLSEGMTVLGTEVQTEAINIFQNVVTEVNTKIYSPWMNEGINRVNIILGKN